MIHQRQRCRWFVRPLDGGSGWCVDAYDGRGAWQATTRTVSHVSMTKAEALKVAARLRLRERRRSAKEQRPNAGEKG